MNWTLTTLSLLAGLVLLVGSGEVIVRASAKIARSLCISPLIIGLTIVAFGTGAPELAVGIKASLANEPGIVVGNVLGGNLCNTLLIMGVCALLGPVRLSSRLKRVEAPLNAIATLLVAAFAMTSPLGWYEGLTLIGIFVAYTGYLITNKEQEHGEVQEQFAQQYGQTRLDDKASLLTTAIVFIAGLIGLILGSDLTVEAASAIAHNLGVSDFLIGITLVAIGTSLPELVTSVSALAQNEQDIALGNILGSNLFNLLIVLGCSGMMSPLEISSAVLWFDLPIACLASFLMLPLFLDLTLTRIEGALLLVSYLAYIITSIADELQFQGSFLFGVVTVSVLIVLLAKVSLELKKHLPSE